MSDSGDPFASRDWRLAAITQLASDWVSPSGVRHPKGTPVEEAGAIWVKGRTIGTMVPHPAALFLSAATRLRESSRDLVSSGFEALVEELPSGELRLAAAREAEYFDCLQAVSGMVLFAFTAIEAVANQLIPDSYVFNKRAEKGITMARTKTEIERWESLDSKLDKVLPDALSIASPRGTGTWQKYERLKSWRDRVVHVKAADVRGVRAEAAKSSLWTTLLQRRVLDAPEYAGSVISYFFQDELPRWLRAFHTQQIG